MNAMEILASQPWVERFGMTLLHFLWQGSVIALLYAGARLIVTRTSSPQRRYLLACGALGAMMAAPLVTWELIRPADASPEAMYRIRSTPATASSTDITTTGSLSDSVRSSVSGVQPEPLLLWVVLVWFAGAMVLWVRLAGGWVVAARMRSMLVRRAPPEWQQSLQELGTRIGLSRPVRLLVSALVQVPTVVGWLRPVVLVPVGALGGLPAEHMEALLLHELAHIRRHDYLMNILQSVTESLLFYHPAVWWLSGHIRTERELCCDDVAVSISGDAVTYARALAQLESYRPAYLNTALAANGGSLRNRIARLLGRPPQVVRTGLGPGVVTVAGLLAVAVYGLAQSADPPRFAVATIKRNPSTEALSMAVPMGVGYRPGGRLVAGNAPVTMLIQRAYSVQGFQVVGGPSWVNTDGYDIEAKPEVSTDQKRMWLMLQTLLADRFKLVMHRATQDLPVYDLQTVRGGPKLPAPVGGNCSEVMTWPPPGPGQPRPAPPCGPGLVKSGTGLTMEGISVSMPAFVKQLSLILGKEVIDKTGFTGRFALHLEFAIDDALAGIPNPVGPSSQPADINDRPSIRTAMQEQLGLKLQASTGPVDVFVIDHVERPGEN
ncbi:MAG TPA: M56 family metallopeptidase [Bryobacteraceae bacterium]|nr:M56 family metallopeptidase [Bryobacteraceae bacterium]